MAFKDAVLEVVQEIRTIKGIRRVPDEPPENNDQFPFVVVTPGEAIYKVGPAGVMTALHSINIELYVSRMDLPRDFNKIMEFIDKIPYELHKLNKDRGFSYIGTIGEILQTQLIEIIWAEKKCLGVQYTMTEVKIQTEIT